MTLAIDSSIIIDWECGHKPTLKALAKIIPAHRSPPKLPFVSYVECVKGIKKRTDMNQHSALAFFHEFQVMQTTLRTAEILADLRFKYEKKGVRLPLADLLIASQSIEHNLTLVTRDRDFEQIEELKKIYL